ncbi:MAG: hypothetical protein AVDCRST_MAG56-7644, partial [uncultured Cytophagales bacterium]
ENPLMHLPAGQPGRGGPTAITTRLFERRPARHFVRGREPGAAVCPPV